MKYLDLEGLKHFKNKIVALIPTKTSQLTNDAGFISKYKDTTYELSKDGNKITLTSSDGEKTTVTDSDTVYSEATQSAAGLMSPADKAKLDGIEDGAGANSVIGVKGSAETTYRTGNVEITKANIGLGNVDNTADSAKSVAYATSAGSATSATSATKATQDASGNTITTTYATKTELTTGLAGKSDTGHTHNYAGSSSAGGAATSANKLNTNAGSTTQPVYFKDGVPVNTNYTVAKSVPSNAKFTDTTYSNATTSAAGLMSAADKQKLENIYPVGAIYTSASSTNPGSELGGTWTLIDKKLKNQTITGKVGGQQNETLSRNYARVLDDCICLDLVFNTVYDLTDTTADLLAFYPSEFGISNHPNVYFTTYSDGGNAIIMCDLKSQGEGYPSLISSVDVVVRGGGTKVATGANIPMSIVIPVPQSYKLDSACDRFIWQRTA